MKYSADNLMLLRKHYNKLYHLVRNRDRDQVNYTLTTTRSGHPGLELKIGDEPYLLYSKYDPMREAEAWVEKLGESVEKAQHVFVYGFGLGYHVEQLIAKYPDKYIHILEPELEIMLAAIEARDLSAILKHKNIGIFAVGRDPLTNTTFVTELTSYLSNSFHAAYLPFYLKRFADEAANISAMFKTSVITDRSNYATRSFFKYEWPENILLNFEKTLHTKSILGLKGKLQQYPAIIVGSGPSLDADIDYLRQYQDKSVIMAAGTSIQALLSRGIRPHIVVSIDGSEKNYEAFKDHNLDNIPFVYGSYLKHKILDELTSLQDVYHCFINTDSITNYFLDVKDPSDLFHSTASVTGTVIQLAVYLGINKIILTGQDLSYPGNTVYASNVDHFSEADQKLKIDRAKDEVPNVSGGTNPTSKVMKHMLENIEALIGSYNKEIEFINTSRIGARIRGTLEIEFNNIEEKVAFQQISPEQLREIFREETVPYSTLEQQQIIDRFQQAYDELKLLQKNEMKTALQELDVLKSRLEQHNDRAVEKCLINIDTAWQRIADSKSFAAIFEMVVQSHITIYKRFLPQIVREQNIMKRGSLVLEHLGALLVAIYNQTPQIIDLMERVLKKIK